MKIPQYLDLCSRLTNQKYVATCLDTQGQVVRSWINGGHACMKQKEAFDFLKRSIIDEYEDFPEIADAFEGIDVELTDWKKEIGNKRRSGRRSLYSKPVGYRESRQRNRVKVNFGGRDGKA